MRSAYAEAATAYLTGTSGGNATVNADGTVDVANIAFKGTNSSDNFSGLADDLPFELTGDEPAATDAGSMTFSWSGDACKATIN